MHDNAQNTQFIVHKLTIKRELCSLVLIYSTLNTSPNEMKKVVSMACTLFLLTILQCSAPRFVDRFKINKLKKGRLENKRSQSLMLIETSVLFPTMTSQNVGFQKRLI